MTADAVLAFDRGVRPFNLVCGAAVGLFDQARQTAPKFTMADLAGAWVSTFANDPGLVTAAAALVERTRALDLNGR